MKDITAYRAVPDGVTDCSPFIKNALSREREIFFPEGRYLISEPILIPSDRHIRLDKNAVIFAADGCFNKPNVRAVVTNSDYENGNSNIIFEGGKIDANSLGNTRESWINGPSSGLTFCFQNVKNLTLRDFTVHNSEAYNVRLSRAENFLVENLVFTADHFPPCQDGIHVSGWSKNGVIRNIKAEKGCTNDDLIAFNADDVNYYCHNWGQENGPISDMLVENVYAEDCWTGLRLLSIVNEISNITVRNMVAGVRCHAVNLDAARYCAHPIFTDDQKPEGVGHLSNILLENMTFWKSENNDRPFVILETNGKIVINNLNRDYEKDLNHDVATVKLKNLHDCHASVNGDKLEMHGEQKLYHGDKFDITIE